jgi:hypothetical protein
MPEDLFAGLFDTDLTAVIGVGDFLLCLGCSLVLGLVMGAGLIAGMGYLGCALLFTLILCAAFLLYNGLRLGGGGEGTELERQGVRDPGRGHGEQPHKRRQL